jgi:pimeloyl-ACP methyl ester carboxylesterase
MKPLLAVEESGSGPPLVLLHGLATDRHIWRQVVPELARRRRVIHLDLPGFGESAPVGEAFELDQVADRVARGLTAHRVRAPFDLVGHSLGAGVALTMAARRPRSISRLVLVAPAGMTTLPAPVAAVIAASADAVLAARRLMAPLAEIGWARQLLLAGTVADASRVPASLAQQMVRASGSATRTAPALVTITTSDLRPLLSLTPAPLGVIWGSADVTMPASLVSVVTQERPDAQVEILEGAGHVPMVECPDEFTAALERLLETLPKD